MSDTEVEYSVVDELEEGEIVENVPSYTDRQSNRKKKLNTGTGVSAENQKIHPPRKRKRKWNKNVEFPQRYPVSFPEMSPKQPCSGQKTAQFQTKPPGNWKNPAVPPKMPLKLNGRKFSIPWKAEHMHEQAKKPLCDNTVPQLDMNSSYDDLLKHHKAIQKALSKLEKEQNRTKKNCPHRKRKKRSSVGSEKSVGGEKKNKAAIHNETSKAIKKGIKKPELLNKIEVIFDNRVRKDSCQTQSNVDTTNSSNITIDTTQGGSMNLHEQKEHDDDLEQLRKKVLMSVPSKSAETTEIRSGFNKENAIPNSSSAFSVSGYRDDYSVMDMEVDEDSCVASHIEVSLPQQSQLSDDDEIASMREKLLLSLNKAANKREPNSRTCGFGEGSAKSANSDPIESGSHVSSSLVTNLAPESGKILPSSPAQPTNEMEHDRVCSKSIQPCPLLNDSTGIKSCSIQHPCPSLTVALPKPLNDSLVLSSTVSVGTADCQSVEYCSPISSGSQDVLEQPSINPLPMPESKPLSEPTKVDKSCSTTSKILSKQFPLKTASMPWVYMKQSPIIINLADDSSDSDSSESGNEKGLPIIDRLDELIRSEKMKTICRQADPPLSEKEDHRNESIERHPPLSEPPSDSVCRESDLIEVTVEPTSSEKNDHTRMVITPKQNSPKVTVDLVREYSLLSRKLSLACDTLQKEQQILAMKKIMANKKKTAFINSQLVTQRLKEQLAAAEKVKKTNMRMMFVANAELETVQNSVLKRTVLLKQMHEQHQKLEEQISSNVPFPLDLILNSE